MKKQPKTPEEAQARQLQEDAREALADTITDQALAFATAFLAGKASIVVEPLQAGDAISARVGDSALVGPFRIRLELPAAESEPALL